MRAASYSLRHCSVPAVGAPQRHLRRPGPVDRLAHRRRLGARGRHLQRLLPVRRGRCAGVPGLCRFPATFLLTNHIKIWNFCKIKYATLAISRSDCTVASTMSAASSCVKITNIPVVASLRTVYEQIFGGIEVQWIVILATKKLRDTTSLLCAFTTPEVATAFIENTLSTLWVSNKIPLHTSASTADVGTTEFKVDKKLWKTRSTAGLFHVDGPVPDQNRYTIWDTEIKALAGLSISTNRTKLAPASVVGTICLL